MIYRFDMLTSTNDEARAEHYRHGDLIVAEQQSAGRGQRGHTWLSPEGENLTFTLVTEPTFLAARDQFLLSEAISVALCDCFAHFGIVTRIKWTNDIYHEDRKLVGMLIEHFYSGDRLHRTLVGIGINVNQQQFDSSLPNPISMSLIKAQHFDRKEVLHTFEEHFRLRYAQLEAGDQHALQEAYRKRMYRLGQEQTFRLPDGELLVATIEGVEPGGALVLRHADGLRHSYQFKEVEFVIDKTTI